MKKYCFLLITLCLVYTYTQAQAPTGPFAYPTAPPASGPNITAIEYYFDNDLPAFGAGTPLIGFTAGLNVTNFSGNLNLPVGMQAGFHRVYIRSKDASGKWSETENVYFDNFTAPAYATVPAASTNVVAMEYFFDEQNPAFGSGIPITGFTTGLNIPNFNTTLTLPAVFPGKFHRVYLRSKDALGKWSQTENSYFDNYTVPSYAVAPATAPPISKIEYFFDTDPGAGNGFMAPALPANSGDVPNFIFNAALGTLQPGDHKIYIRSRQNPFSLSSSMLFNKTAPALPINLISFVGKPTEKGNELIWETAGEINNALFEIEKSNDKGLKFNKIGQVVGANNSNEKLVYTFLDETVESENFYRLKQVDLDGKYAYSKIIFVKNENKNEFKIFPNPVINDLEITNKTGEAINIELFNNQGKLISNNNKLSGFKINLPMADLPKGIYMLKMKNDRHSFLQKIVKQ
jgi:hypothetical protein